MHYCLKLSSKLPLVLLGILDREVLSSLRLPVLGLPAVTIDLERPEGDLVSASGRVGAIGESTVPVPLKGAAGVPVRGEGEDLADGLALGVDDVGADLGGAHGKGEHDGRVDRVGVLGLVGLAGGREGKDGAGGDGRERGVAGLAEVAVLLVEDGDGLHAADDALVGERVAGGVGAVEGDVAGVDGEALGIETLGRDGEDGDGLLLAGVKSELGGGDDEGSLVRDQLVGEVGGVDRVGVCESVGSSSAGVAELVGDGLLASVGNLEALEGLDVRGVVEGDAGDAEKGVGVGSIPGLDQTSTLLGDGGKHGIGRGAIVEEVRVGSGREEVLEDSGVLGATLLHDKGPGGSSKRAGHGGTGKDSVRAESTGVGGKDHTAGSRDLGLDINLVGRAPRGIGAEEASGIGVGEVAKVLGGGLRVSHVDNDLGASLKGLDPSGAGLRSDHSRALDASDGADIDLGRTSGVVVEDDVLGSLGGSVLSLLDEGAAATTDESDVLGEVRGVIGESLAAVGGIGSVEVDRPDRKANIGPGAGGTSGKAESRSGAAGDGVSALAEKSRGNDVVDRADSSDPLAVGSSGSVEDTLITTVTSRDKAGNALLDDPADDGSPGVLGPTRGTTDGGSDDVRAIIVGLEVSLDEDIVTDITIATEHTVSTEGHIGSGTNDAVGVVGLTSHYTRDMCAVTLAVHWVGIRDGSVGTVEVVTNQIGTVGDQAASTEAAAEGRMKVVDTSVDNGDLDALASNAGVPELVDLGHQVRSEGVLGGITLGDNLLDGAASIVDGVLGDGVAADRVHGLDTRHGSNLAGQVLGLVEVLELEGSTLEKLMANILADGGIALDGVKDRSSLASTSS